MSLLVQAHGINTFLAETYDPTIMLVDVLVRIGFAEQQSQALYADHSEAILSAYVDAIRFRLVTARQDGDRLFHILTRRYSFDGERASTLEELGVHWQVSRERIRQLQRKAIRSCRSSTTKIYCEAVLYQTGSLLGVTPRESTTASFYAERHALSSNPALVLKDTLPHPDDREFIADLICVILERIP